MLIVGSSILAGAAMLWFVYSAWTGEGPAHRLAQWVWVRIWSLSHYQKSGVIHATVPAVLAHRRVSALERLTATVSPSLAGWFSPLPTDKGGFHDYLPQYETLFAPYRRRAGVRLLEVGVHKGGSLALWREYFADDARITGMDCNPGVQTFPCDVGIKVVVADSRDPAVVTRTLCGQRFDVIIDDGLHHPEAQERTFRALRPLLAPDGIYIIEDVYAFDPSAFMAFGDSVAVFADRSRQYLVAVRPAGSIAGEPAGSLGAVRVSARRT